MKKQSIFLMAALIFVMILAAVYTVTHKSITDIKKYRQWDTKDLHGKLNVFPQKIKVANTEDYLYKFSEVLLDSDYQIYLKCSYSKDMYQAEVERLCSIADEYEGKENKIVYDEENFNLPAYVSVYNFDNTYEYALLDEEHFAINYIYLQFAETDKIKFDKNLLPIQYSSQEIDDSYTQRAHRMTRFSSGQLRYNIYAHFMESAEDYVIDNAWDR